MATVLTAAPLEAQGGPPGDILPLHPGNSWTYDGTIWWVPHNSRRVLEERVTLEVEVVEVVDWGRMRGAILRGFPRDLVSSATDRFRGEFTLLQVGSRVHLLRGEAGREAMRRLRERDESVAGLVRDAEVILELPLTAGKTFCPEGARGAGPRRCWLVEAADRGEPLRVYGLREDRARERFVLGLRSDGDHERRGFVPGVGFTSFAIGHVGDPSALELELVAVDLAPPQGIFLKTLDLASQPAMGIVSVSGPADDRVGEPSGAGPAENPPRSRRPLRSGAGAQDEAARGDSAGGDAPPRPAPAAPPVAEVVPQPVAPAPPADTDGDGVPDPDDRCAATPAGETVDRRGCPLPPPGRTFERRPAPEPLALRVVPEEIPVPEYDQPACLDDREWFLGGDPIEFEGRQFDPIGTPEPISLDNLVTIGEYDGVPLYVGRYARRPHTDVWLPVCSNPDTYRLYADLRSRS